MEYVFKTKGVCPREIIIECEGDTVESVCFNGGCNGNGKGIGALVSGMKIDDVIDRCSGITCDLKTPLVLTRWQRHYERLKKNKQNK